MTTSNQVTAETIARTQKRVAKMSERDLLEWADVALPGMHRHLDLYRRTGDEAHLVELSIAEMQLSIVLTALIDTKAAKQEEGLTT